MPALMPRKAAPKHTRPVSPTNPNTAVLYARSPVATIDGLDAWTAELNAAAEASGDPRRWTRNDVINALVARALKTKKPGDLP